MIDATKSEVARLFGMARGFGFSDTDEDSIQSNEKEIDTRKPMWHVCCLALLVGFFAGSALHTTKENLSCTKTPPQPPVTTCKFCDQSPPTLHDDRSYTILLPDRTNNKGADKSVVVTPMTFAYDYELYDGQMLFTNNRKEIIPNLEFDYAILGMGSIRNLHRDTGEPVSLDEVYLHHFTLRPISMVGAEGLNRNMDDDPLMMFPDGYALHVMAEEQPYFGSTAHLLSNKNLAPINGSLDLARKECNECYYGPTKGSHCTPEVSGTFLCCGDSVACMIGGEECVCATTTTERTTRRYRIEVDFLVSRDIESFVRVDQWTFLSSSCSVNLVGDPILEDYPTDSYCSELSSPRSPRSYLPGASLMTGGGSLYHQVPEQPNAHPYLKTTKSYIAPASGTIVFAQSHLHTGGVNATLYLNGRILCTNTAEHGTNSDPLTNAGNEQNHLIHLSSCYDQISTSSTGGIRFEKGDVLTSESYYHGGTNDSRFSSAVTAGEHKNAMSYFGTGVVFDPTSSFLAEARTSLNLFDNFVNGAGYNPSSFSSSSEADQKNR